MTSVEISFRGCSYCMGLVMREIAEAQSLDINNIDFKVSLFEGTGKIHSDLCEEPRAIKGVTRRKVLKEARKRDMSLEHFEELLQEMDKPKPEPSGLFGG